MNVKIGYFLMFVSGAVIGSAVAIRTMKNRYKQIAQEEIDSVKEVFRSHNVDERIDNAREALNELAEELGYADKTSDEEFEEEEEKPAEGPYVIPPEEFGEKADDGYEAVTLTYHSDGVLVDENDRPIDDVENTIGEDSLNHFGEYEDDSVFVRDDWRKVDYEILRDIRPYSQILEENPYLRNSMA